jgi:predicted amidohydrolase
MGHIDDKAVLFQTLLEIRGSFGLVFNYKYSHDDSLTFFRRVEEGACKNCCEACKMAVMKEKTLAAVALNNRDFADFEEKLEEAVRWIDFSACAGADLVVLPEAMNLYRGDGDIGAHKVLMDEARQTMGSWRQRVDVLFQAARGNKVALTVPLIVPHEDYLINCFFLISSEGMTLGRLVKMYPTPSELSAGIRRGRPGLIDWEGLKVGGAICFDCYFPQVFEQQRGADLFLIPSLTSGGLHLDFHAMNQSAPIVLAYPAYSRIIDIDGAELDGAGYRNESLRFGHGAPVAIARINFDRVALFADGTQEKIVNIQEEYGSKVRIRFDQSVGIYYVESRSDDLSMAEVVRRFGLTTQRDYFDECARRVEGSGFA